MDVRIVKGMVEAYLIRHGEDKRHPSIGDSALEGFEKPADMFVVET